MKRSEINTHMGRAVEFLNKMNFKLPPFAFWSPGDWKKRGPEFDEIRECMLGWDITDLGMGKFEQLGAILFTIRNGNDTNPKYTNKTYCEKIIILYERQVIPLHFHWKKTEDIINRGGGNMVIQLYNATADGRLSDKEVEASIDGCVKSVRAGEPVTLLPGESICLPPRLYHRFWAEKGMGLFGEVSKVNDDKSDNRFYEEMGRFPTIEEDEEPLYLLCSEYPKAR
ncbi:MAG: D-lyxose/D-mannose family sugar isomerase [Candidatus Omnitrophica bacterium]|nr:D-lyxose/D-mannose family sugar isomerase [Candidatus Omnitrophota bacterium]